VTAPAVLVLRAPGTNCDRETAFAFRRAGARVVEAHVNALLERPARLRRLHGVVLPGGFSYGDDLGAGTVLGTRIRTALRDELRRLVDRGGIVLGICNGFQVLVKTGLLPGLEDALSARRVALAGNLQNRYEDRWVVVEARATNAFFRRGDRITCPVAHAEGRFFFREASVHAALEAGSQVALRYVAPDGRTPAPFPWNPNGSLCDVAGITDPTGRVLGMMPHPERNQFPWQDPRFHAGTAPARPEGLLPFHNAVLHLVAAFDLA
jgi:phosphoribosylformylglycinamidine synthase I